MTRILCTGSAGFIGSHLVERLLENKSNKIIVIDNLNTGKLSNLPKNKNLKVYVKSILDEDIDGLFDEVDIVFHLAALTRPQWAIEHPLEADRINVGGTLKILKHCKDNYIKRVVFTSSSSCYGTPENFPTTESEPPRSMSPYGIQKYIGELY